MKRISLSVFVVLLLITIDVNISMAYDESKVKIFKVTNIANAGKLHLRAWPSSKSRIKVSLPSSAKDLIETGKSKLIGRQKWLEVTWNKKKGWVNGRYLKKTGVLLHAKRKSRNVNTQNAATQSASLITAVTRSTSEMSNQIPSAFGGDRYDQPVQDSAFEVKTAFSGNKSRKILNCSGSSPEPWNLKLNMTHKKMQVNLKSGRSFSLPINYHAWATPNKVRMSMGGNKGRNVVDVNLEKTDACSNGLARTNFPYKVNATINRQFYSGCCQSVNN